jgi:uncharacterized Zn finger protein
MRGFRSRRRVGRSSYFEHRPKKAPPADGIKLKKGGTTWWGEQWIAALTEVLSGDSARLSRGRTYARAGRVHELVVKGGKVTAKVTGSRATPYKVSIELAQLSDSVWKRAVAGMTERVKFAAELLAGHMPTDIDEVFEVDRASLFPQRRADLKTACSCPDCGDPCKHVAATHYVLGEALDGDPFLLFELRGRSREQMLAELRAARSGGTTRADPEPRGETEPATVELDLVSAEAYDALRTPLGELHFAFEADVQSGAMLRQLGTPAGWSCEASPEALLGPLLQAASERARLVAMAEPDTKTEPATLAPKRARKKRS